VIKAALMMNGKSGLAGYPLARRPWSNRLEQGALDLVVWLGLVSADLAYICLPAFQPFQLLG
jgi:hypothetical protein